jgi:hypothetical protein
MVYIWCLSGTIINHTGIKIKFLCIFFWKSFSSFFFFSWWVNRVNFVSLFTFSFFTRGEQQQLGDTTVDAIRFQRLFNGGISRSIQQKIHKEFRSDIFSRLKSNFVFQIFSRSNERMRFSWVPNKIWIGSKKDIWHFLRDNQRGRRLKLNG